MKPENLPRLTWSVRVHAPKHGSAAVCSLHTLDRQGHEIRLRSWEWPGGRPTAGLLADLVAAVGDDLTTVVVTFIGVQEELMLPPS
jgi:hypothetical protein